MPAKLQNSVRIPSQGLKKTHKLLTKQDFAHVFAKPARYHHACFTILCRANQRHYSRLGLAVAKKAMRRAVARNRFKRQVRESFRLGMLALHDGVDQDGHQNAKQDKLAGQCKGLDIVVIAKAAAGQQSKQAVRKALDQQWHLLIASCK